MLPVKREKCKPESYWEHVFGEFDIRDPSQFDYGDHIPLRFDGRAVSPTRIRPEKVAEDLDNS